MICLPGEPLHPASDVNSVKTSYEQNVKSSLDGLATNLDSTGFSLVNLLGQVDNSIKQISSVTGSASTDLSTVKEALEQTVSLLNESSEKLQMAVMVCRCLKIFLSKIHRRSELSLQHR